MEQTVKKKSFMNTVIDGISAIFLPIINILSAAGILKGILIILTSTSVLSEESQTYMVLYAIADSLFYFLPILLAYTAAVKFKANPYLAVVIAGALLYPSVTELMDASDNLNVLALPMKSVIYHSSVIPIIMAVGLLHFVEGFLNKVTPALIRGFFVPLVSMVVVTLITLFVFGPIGGVIGDALANGYKYVFDWSPVVAGFLLGAAIQPMVIFGMHWSFALIAMNNVAVNGSDTVVALISAAVFAQVGATLAVMVKSKQKELKSTCMSAAITAVFGVTEPCLFGINLPRKKPFIAVIIGGGVGGAVAALSGATASAFSFPSIATLPLFFGDGFVMYVISNVVGLVVAFVACMLMPFEADIELETKEG